MIQPEDTEILRTKLGTRYTKAVLEILKSNGITNSKGLPFSVGFISHVLNGLYENQAIESAIYEVVALKQKTAKKLLKRKKQIIKKPEADTSGKS